MAKIHINFHITNPYSEKMWFLGSGWGKFWQASGCDGGGLLLFDEGACFLGGLCDLRAGIHHIPKRIGYHIEWCGVNGERLELGVERSFGRPEMSPCGAIALRVAPPRRGVGINVDVANLELVWVGAFFSQCFDRAHFFVV